MEFKVYIETGLAKVLFSDIFSTRYMRCISTNFRLTSDMVSDIVPSYRFQFYELAECLGIKNILFKEKFKHIIIIISDYDPMMRLKVDLSIGHNSDKLISKMNISIIEGKFVCNGKTNTVLTDAIAYAVDLLLENDGIIDQSKHDSARQSCLDITTNVGNVKSLLDNFATIIELCKKSEMLEKENKELKDENEQLKEKINSMKALLD